MRSIRTALALAFALLALQASALKLRIEPYASECVTEVATIDGDRVTGSFVGTAEGAYRTARNFFDLEVKSEDGTTLHTVRNRQDAKFEFVVPRAGRFTACIRNYGRHAADVTYHSFVGHKVEHDKLTSDHLGPVRNSLGSMRNTLRQLLEEQLYQENRDTMHSQTNKSTARRAVAWAAIEACVLCTISVGQVMLIKRLFESSPKMQRSSFGFSNSRGAMERPVWSV